MKKITNLQNKVWPRCLCFVMLWILSLYVLSAIVSYFNDITATYLALGFFQLPVLTIIYFLIDYVFLKKREFAKFFPIVFLIISAIVFYPLLLFTLKTLMFFYNIKG